MSAKLTTKNCSICTQTLMMRTKKFVNSNHQKRRKKKRKSWAEQREIYQELLNLGKVKNQAEIA